MNFFHRRKPRNRVAIECLKDLKYHPADIRKALLDLNRIPIRRLVNGGPPSIVYSTIKGVKKNRLTMELMASELNLAVDELFPEVK